MEVIFSVIKLKACISNGSPSSSVKACKTAKVFMLRQHITRRSESGLVPPITVKSVGMLSSYALGLL